MIQLTPQNIQLHAKAQDKENAIRTAGRVLIDGGYIAPGYVDSMVGREMQANTYLGNGIAIPHGLGKDRDLIHRTGVSVVQFPEGVEWNPGQTVRLVVGIAAKSDEHLSILAALTDVLDDSEKVERLARTDNPSDIIAGLTRRDGDRPAAVETLAPGARSVDVVIAGTAGLHARPATVFVELAMQFQSDIRVQYGAKTANGKAMGSMLTLGAESGATIRLIASGPDAGEALEALKAAVESGLGEAEHEVESAPAEVRIWQPGAAGTEITGIAAAPGLAIARIFQFRTSRIFVRDTHGEPGVEKQRLQKALDDAREELIILQATVKEHGGESEAAIFRAHQALLSDIDLFTAVSTLIDDGHSADWSWQHEIEKRVTDVRQLRDARLAGRAADLQDIGQRVLRLLAGVKEGELQLPDKPVILVAEDLTPSDTAKLHPDRVVGLCTVLGGPTSHTAIIARSLGIPAAVGVDSKALELADEVTCILDGGKGSLYVEPSATDLESARAFQEELRRLRDVEVLGRYQPAMLTDGYRVEVVANIGKAADAAAAVEAGAEGVGLLRTEFLFLERETPPSEEEQFAAYSEMTKSLAGLPLIIRTLDIGGDKVVPYLSLPKEENPFLGVRGIRLCLQKPELFRPQLRAIYRASLTGPVKIMFPMIATLEDLRAAKEIAEQVRQEVDAPPVEIGIMVEVPSTVMMAPEFAREVDFFSVGTNDLTQYALAMDRMHPALASQVDALHPAVLRMIDSTVRAAEPAGKWVGVCGGIAGDPLGAVILTGLGIAELSMSIPSVPEVKARLRKVSRAQARAIAKRALGCTTAEEVRAIRLPA